MEYMTSGEKASYTRRRNARIRTMKLKLNADEAVQTRKINALQRRVNAHKSVRSWHRNLKGNPYSKRSVESLSGCEAAQTRKIAELQGEINARKSVRSRIRNTKAAVAVLLY